jgi:hypothetical protein
MHVNFHHYYMIKLIYMPKFTHGKKTKFVIYSSGFEKLCMLKHKVFFWLVMYDGINTRNLIQGKNFHIPSYNCVLCNEEVTEILQHMFWDCAFA